MERAKNMALQACNKRSAKHLSMRQHHQARSFDLPTQYRKYDLFRPIHEMWESYVRSLVAECNNASLHPWLLATDLHRAILAVVESKNTSYMGFSIGVVVKQSVCLHFHISSHG